MRVRFLTAAVLAALLWPAGAAAQLPTPDPAITVPDYGSIIVNDQFLRQGLNPGGASSKPRKRSRRATPAQLRRLRYRSADSVTTALRPRLFERLTEGMDAACCAALIEEVRFRVEQDVDLGQFERNMDSLDTRRGNLADALGVAAALLYAGYHLEPGERPQTEERGVQRYVAALRQRLAKRRGLRRMSDAAKQRRAETLGIVAQFALTIQYSWLTEVAAEPGRIAVLDPFLDRNREMMHDLLADELDLDPDEYRLTKRGFVRR